MSFQIGDIVRLRNSKEIGEIVEINPGKEEQVYLVRWSFMKPDGRLPYHAKSLVSSDRVVMEALAQ